MKQLLILGIAVFGVLNASKVVAEDGLPFRIVGQSYASARVALMQNGSQPISQGPKTRPCLGYEDACAKYQELSDCAVDQPLCRFEWRLHNGKAFDIITDATGDFAVEGLNSDDPHH